LPAPFGPRKPVTVPRSSEKLTPSTATSSPYRFISERQLATASRCAGPTSSRTEGARPAIIPILAAAARFGIGREE